MRRMLSLLLLLALPLAQAADKIAEPATKPAPAPAKPLPLPAVPPPPPEMSPLADALDEPQVTIKKRDGETVEEFRLNGRLYMVKITPDSGPAYYLVDDQGDGKFVRHSFDGGVRPPMWVIKTF